MPYTMSSATEILSAICREIIPSDINYHILHSFDTASLELELNTTIPNITERIYIRTLISYEMLYHSRDNMQPLMMVINTTITALLRGPTGTIKKKKKSRLPDWF